MKATESILFQYYKGYNAMVKCMWRSENIVYAKEACMVNKCIAVESVKPQLLLCSWLSEKWHSDGTNVQRMHLTSECVVLPLHIQMHNNWQKRSKKLQEKLIHRGIFPLGWWSRYNHTYIAHGQTFREVQVVSSLSVHLTMLTTVWVCTVWARIWQQH